MRSLRRFIKRRFQSFIRLDQDRGVFERRLFALRPAKAYKGFLLSVRENYGGTNFSASGPAAHPCGLWC